MAFRPGDSIAGRYLVEDVIAEGGMGVIYAARHAVLGERVAIKCLLPELSADAEQTARLLGEARAAARIKSEHVARITDADRLPDGTVFLAMERLEGRDLDAELEARHSLPVSDAIAYVLQAGEALAEAHACGIIHRDLKPANLFASRRTDGSTCIKVLDFGISKVLPHEAQVRTRTGTFMGTPMYASPEQLTTPGDIDRRTDIWALGCVLYELLAGEPPFVRDTLGALVTAIVSAPFTPVSARRPDVPVAIDAAIARCLEKDRTRRWNDIAELAAALAAYSPAQAAISLPRIQALVRPSGHVAFAATESGHLSAPPPTPLANVARTAPAGAASSMAPLSAPERAAPAPAPRTASMAPWILVGVLAVALAGGAMARRMHRVEAPPSPAAAEDTPGAAVTATASTVAPIITAPPVASASASPATSASGTVVRDGAPRAGATTRPGVRRGTAASSGSGRIDDWKPPIKE